MKTLDKDRILMECGEALENCVAAMKALGAPETLCELVEAKSVLYTLNGLFGLKEGVSFSNLLSGE